MRVFLSYRRGDAGGYAGRLTDTLIQRLGARSVFHDVTAISPGEDYTVAIDRALADCDAALVVIGPGWLTAESPQGARRLFEPGDYVRLELATMLRRGVRAVPVLVSQAWSSIALSNDPTAVDKADSAGQLIFKVKSASWRPHNGHWEVVLATSMKNTTQETVYHEVWRYDYLVVAQRPFTPACFSANGDTVDAGRRRWPPRRRRRSPAAMATSR